MGIISWIILGLIAGAIAKAIVGGGAGGWLMTMLLGILGAVVGGWLGSAIFNVGLGSFFSIKTWVLSILGGLIVTFLYNKLTNKS